MQLFDKLMEDELGEKSKEICEKEIYGYRNLICDSKDMDAISRINIYLL